MTEHGEVLVDVYSKLSDNRILFITDYFDDRVASDIAATLLLKDAENDEEKITLFLNSEGGNIRAVFAIYDLMQLLNSPIETVCVGAAMGEVVLLLAAGTKGMRFATQNSVICVSQLAQENYYRANLEDAGSILKRIHKDNKNFMTALAKGMGKKTAEVSSQFERKTFMNAKQAKSVGLIDGIVGVN